MPELQGAIFDLDGVLVRTDRYHYQAWKELADSLGIPFDEEKNHRLRGVSREESLRRIYGDRPLPPPDEFRAQCDRKNARYRELISGMTPGDVLPGAVELLGALRATGVGCAIASASKNCPLVLERTGLEAHADAVVDGTDVTESKPDPQGFLLAAERLDLAPMDCVGVEDAASGIEAIHRAGMPAVGIGPAASDAELVVDGVDELTVDALRGLFADE
jgi:beta-phosphoglucomutase